MSQAIDSSIRFWDRKAISYAKQPIADMEAYEKKLALTRKFLTPQSSVLEFGCGTGSTALLHAPRVNDLLAIDSSQAMIEIASEKLEKEPYTNLRFQQATLFDLPTKKASYDVILGLNVIHLLDDPVATIKRCHELLVPGGVLITSTACIAHTGFLIRKLLPVGAALGLIPKVNIFSRGALIADMKDAGFTILENHTFNKSGYNVFMVVQKEK